MLKNKNKGNPENTFNTNNVDNAGPETQRLIKELGFQSDHYRKYFYIACSLVVLLLGGLYAGFEYSTQQLTEVAAQAKAKVNRANTEVRSANAKLEELEASNNQETLKVTDTKDR